jgi:3-hydroxyacyl-CoA dehydrogenase/enoyl-CoA hydratase/3-hydroxybutyryl-CoA epimerase
MGLLDELPLPEGAPEPGACVRVERPETGLAVVVLDPPHRKLAVLDLPLMRDLDATFDKLSSDTGLKGVVITGRTPTSFAAGADVDAIRELTDGRLATELSRYGHRLFAKIENLSATTVAAVGGPVPGGAYELSLACDFIVLADHKSSRIGLPETQLGILPGWGGCNRLPRRVGVPKALAAILAGKLHVPRQAKKLGLVDRLTKPEYLVRVASDIAMGRARVKPQDRGVWRVLIDKNPIAIGIIAKQAGEQLAKKTRGHYPAPELALKLVVNAPRTPMAEGLEREAVALGKLAVSPECKSLVNIFKLSEEAKRLAKQPDGTPGADIARAGVIGGGVMGAAIAGLFAERGLDTRLSDLERKPLDAALFHHARRVNKKLKRRRLKPHEARAATDRLTVTTKMDGLRQADLVIEAVAERLDVKRSVFGAVAAVTGPETILATNTSSLSVDAIAAELPHPERVVGMHFFNPVHLMPLVEIVRGEKTSDAAVAAIAKLCVRLGKTPVVTKDVAGFLVNRLLGPYLDEAVRILEQGVDPKVLDEVAVQFGMPMGPLELLDEVGLDIASHAAESLETAYGARMKSSDVVHRMLEAGLTGKKGGAGFWLYEHDAKTGRPKKTTINPRLESFVKVRTELTMNTSPAAIVDQLILSMVNEAALALEEHVVAGPRELDLATVFGMGFPPFRGGLLRYADARGSRDVLSALRRLQAAPDIQGRASAQERFKPADSLVALAERDGRFHG